MHNITQDIIDLVLWFEERGYTREKMIQAFDEAIWFIDNNSKIHVYDHNPATFDDGSLFDLGAVFE